MPPSFSSFFRDAETTIVIKFASWRGSGRGKFEGKLSKNAVLFWGGEFHDNKIWKIRKYYFVRNFVVISEAPNFDGVVCSNTLFSNTSALTDSLLFRANSTCQGSRAPRLVEHFWVPILGASCSNKLFVGTLRPSHFATHGVNRAISALQRGPNGKV